MIAATSDVALGRIYDETIDAVIVSEGITVSHHAAVRAVYERGLADAAATAAHAFAELGEAALGAAQTIEGSLEGLGAAARGVECTYCHVPIRYRTNGNHDGMWVDERAEARCEPGNRYHEPKEA